ncbi:MAG: glycosyltransferase family 87 protein [Paracoccaceae bacterium]
MTGTRADNLAAVVVLCLWMVAHLIQLWGTWPYDLAAVYIAGHFWETGQHALVYAAPEHFFGGPAPEWNPTIVELGGAGKGTFPFIYPPVWAALVAPLTRLMTAQTFFNLALLVQLPLMTAYVPLAGRIARPALPAWKWALVGIVVMESATPFFSAINQNQPSILIGFLILLAMERSLADAPRSAGLALALAAAIKITPAVFALLFVLRRDWRSLGWFLGFAALLLAVDLWLGGMADNRAFLAALRGVGGASLVGVVNISARSLIDYGLALAFGARIYATESMYILELPGALRHLSGLVNLGLWLGLGGRAIVAARALPDRPRMVVSLLALSVGLFLFGPLGWQHYYVLPLALLPGLLTLPPAGRAFAAALPALVGANIILFNMVPADGSSSTWYVSFAAGCWIVTLWQVGSLAHSAAARAGAGAQQAV